MAIAPGDMLPDTPVQSVGNQPAAEVQKAPLRELLGAGRAVLVCVPGAFTPTCSEQHLPGYVARMDEFRARNAKVACLAVNDAFVMQAWAQQQGVPEDLLMLADGNGDVVRALGLELDANAYGMGVRGKRFALYAEDGVVRAVHVEAPGELRASTAEAMLELIPQT